MEYITLRLPRGVALGSGAARTLVSYALRRSGRRCWPFITVEAFRGGETLMIARPSGGIEVRLADYVFPLLRKKFTE